MRPWAPSTAAMREADREAASARWTYAEQGATRGPMPSSYSHEEQWVGLGRGEETYRRAVDAVQRFEHFGMDWIRVQPGATLAPDASFTFASYQLGLWIISSCRVVYVEEDVDGPVQRFQYGYGTVGDHAVCGEESFVVEWNRESGSVRFGVRKFSRPANWLSRATAPIVRTIQSRFTTQALERLQEAVQ